MVVSIGRWQQYCRWTLMACGALAFFLVLGGCAANVGTSVSESTADLVTPSDEPDARRRARIRLELASNYFEMGQTAVALDEVKQSLASDATYADAYNLRGLIYLRLNDFVQAEESFRRAQALRPGDANLLHNFGWLLCQQKKYAEADQQFVRALSNPGYVARSKTLMARGLCQVGAGQYAEAEQSLIKAYELDAANPVVGYHLSALLLRRNELSRAQFYIRRINNSEYANSESLWLGIKVERALGDIVASRQLAEQLRKRFPDSREWGAFERGAFNE
ncbi:type IV pilus biogenesis/stability protein PilW [Acidovorax carolinensis]|uniref:type IV pilus biogenesis/stability protein PilW n=1 Tax=Acidovorax carolinensis TaxID=553814 RepID=UPI000B3481D5|nr:type IV pilus biogenesis/stability protein PilW [Acidovorax carolinensis]ART48895.1 type IV pilus biogenesis/stability protein PilW [Acidovorax carolinensis]